jgi:hypothetical protein
MTQESQAIEVEVVAIDGAAPAVRNSDPAASPPPWRNWRGRTLKLDGYWWPLWVILGAIALFLVLTAGLFFGVVYLILRLLRGMIRWMVR